MEGLESQIKHFGLDATGTGIPTSGIIYSFTCDCLSRYSILFPFQ